MTIFGAGLDIQRGEIEAVHDHWILYLAQGVILAVLGLLALGSPFVTTVVAGEFVGVLLVIGGIVGLAGLFTARGMPGFLWTLLASALAILFGMFLIFHPLAGILSLTLGLGIFFAAQGIAQIFASLAHRRVLRSWGWVLASGVVDLILAGIIIAGWPETATWVIGVLVGVNLLVYGVALVMTAIACRSVTGIPSSRAGAI